MLLNMINNIKRMFLSAAINVCYLYLFAQEMTSPIHFMNQIFNRVT